MSSLFRRLTRYRDSDALSPKENRLTEAFAAVLERVDGLAAELVTSWAGLTITEGAEVGVDTQVRTHSGGFVDLEVVFGSSGAPEARIWIENKHGADLHPGQPDGYIRDLATLGSPSSRVILLAPRQSMPETEAPVTKVEWQEAARQLELRRRRTDDPVARWLLWEFLAFLKEEQLTDDDALTTAHCLALQLRPATDRVVGRLVQLTQGRVDTAWGSATSQAGGSTPRYGPGWWAVHNLTPTGEPEPAQTRWVATDFEWQLGLDQSLPEPHGGYVFYAGATFRAKDNPIANPANNAWLIEAGERGFQRMQHGGWWRLWRWSYPERLLGEDTLDRQAAILAEWVVNSFRDLAALPPPH